MVFMIESYKKYLEIIKSSSKQLKITERRIRKFNSYRKPLEKKATQEFCKTYFPESEEKCNADQKLFEFLPANAVEGFVHKTV